MTSATLERAIVLTGVSKRFARGLRLVTALSGVSLRFAAGEVSAVYGPNGAGKTTMLRCLIGAANPTGGGIAHEPAGRRHVIGYVAEGGRGFHVDLTARQNLRWAQLSAGGADVTSELVRRLPSLIQILDDPKPARRLSRGQRQVLAIAMAMAARPDFLLLDEPFNGLDPAAYEAVAEALRALASEGVGVVVSTHDLRFAQAAAVSYFLRDGRVVGRITPDMPRTLSCEVKLARSLAPEEQAALAKGASVAGERIRFDGDPVAVAEHIAQLPAHLVRDLRVVEAALERMYYD
jgi:ABC-2 type transport system ATP-binding protein